MKKVLIITGLTASGKSGLALDFATRYNGEIISADSVQIYRGLNIGSAKDTEAMTKVKHHLIDIKNFDETYNVGEFITDCSSAINDTLSRAKLPIIVGGTGLYVKALMEGYTLGESTANLSFRYKYEKLAKEKGNQVVWDELNNLNPDKAKTVHPNNLKRVIRYLELEKIGTIQTKSESILKDYEVLAIGIICDREEIYDQINKRVDQMLEIGLLDEVKGLIQNGAKRENQSMNSIGYKEWFDYFEGETDYNATVDLIKQHTRNYCKRQLTFLKTIPNLELMTINEARDKIEGFLNDNN